MSAAAITSPVDAAIERWRESIPEALWEQQIFLLWQKRPKPGRPGKFDKIPIYANGRQRHGENGSPSDREQLVDFGDALVAYQRSRAHGFGMALLADVPVWALDLDDCIFANGQLSALAQRVILAGSYTEHSPSGRGVRALYAGKAGIDAKNHKVGVEIFDSRGFVTLTGERLGGDTLLPCPTELLNLLVNMVKASKSSNADSALVPCRPRAKEPNAIGCTSLPERVRRRLEAPYASGDDRSAVAYSIALQLARAGITAHEALEIMSVPAVLEPALERRGGDIESARMWMWRYVVLPAYSGTIA